MSLNAIDNTIVTFSLLGASGMGVVGYLGGRAMSGLMTASAGAMGMTCAGMPIIGSIIYLACRTIGKDSGFVAIPSAILLAYPSAVVLANLAGSNVYLVQPITALAIGSVVSLIYLGIGCVVVGGVLGIALIVAKKDINIEELTNSAQRSIQSFIPRQ